MKKLLVLFTLSFMTTVNAASVGMELERLGLTDLEFYSRMGAQDKVRLVDVLEKVEKNSEKHIVLTYTAHTSAKTIQYNGNITAKIFTLPTNLKYPECIISLDIGSDFDTPYYVTADLSNPNDIFPIGAKNCDYGI